MFISYLQDDPFFFLSWIVVVTFSICLHEYAHAVTALGRGDDTAAREGHLTLNPMVQMGPMSLILLCVIGMAWGSVPVNPGRFAKRSDAALIAFAGPLANLVLCAVFAALSLVTAELPLFRSFFLLGCHANGVLFVLNMLPVPMLDGWSVFSMFVPAMGRVAPSQAQNISLAALVMIFLTPLGEAVWTGGRALGGVWLHLFSFLA